LGIEFHKHGYSWLKQNDMPVKGNASQNICLNEEKH